MDIIERQADYAVRVLMHLAANGHEGPVSLRELAAANQVPEEFLRKIAPPLATAGLVRSERGRNGGLRLACDPRRISLLDVMQALDSAPSINRCFVDADICDRRRVCAVHKRLARIQKQITDLLAQANLAEILEATSAHRNPRTGTRQRRR